MIDYALAKKLHTRHKGALTRARKKGPDAVLTEVQAFYADFENNGLPLPDDWHRWKVAAEDAHMDIRFEQRWAQ